MDEQHMPDAGTPDTTTEVEIPVELDAPHRRAVIGDEPMIFHCHHYNTFLQQSIQDAHYIESKAFLVGAASEVAYGQLTKIFARQRVADVASRNELAATLFRWAGFGTVDLSVLDADGGTLHTPHSHYSHAWQVKLGTSDKPVDLFTTGWVAGALSAIHGLPQGAFDAQQTACMAMGADTNTFVFTRVESPTHRVFETPGVGPLTTHEVHDVPATGVDYDGIFAALTGMDISGDATGSIPAFGVYLTRHYANYYNRISFEFVRELTERFGDTGREVAEPLLIEAGHVCAFNTFGGIMTSTEWEALILPTLETREDWVHGIVAAVNALGWGRWQVTSVSEEEAVFVLHDDYESLGHLAAYGTAPHNVSWLAQGAVMGIMDLVYVGDVASKPTFSPAFYDRLFKSDDSYRSEVRSSRAMGDAVTSFRVFRG